MESLCLCSERPGRLRSFERPASFDLVLESFWGGKEAALGLGLPPNAGEGAAWLGTHTVLSRNPGRFGGRWVCVEWGDLDFLGRSGKRIFPGGKVFGVQSQVWKVPLRDPQGQPHWILNHMSQWSMLCENQSASSGGAKASLPRQRYTPIGYILGRGGSKAQQLPVPAPVELYSA